MSLNTLLSFSRQELSVVSVKPSLATKPFVLMAILTLSLLVSTCSASGYAQSLATVAGRPLPSYPQKGQASLYGGLYSEPSSQEAAIEASQAILSIWLPNHTHTATASTLAKAQLLESLACDSVYSYSQFCWKSVRPLIPCSSVCVDTGARVLPTPPDVPSDSLLVVATVLLFAVAVLILIRRASSKHQHAQQRPLESSLQPAGRAQPVTPEPASCPACVSVPLAPLCLTLAAHASPAMLESLKSPARPSAPLAPLPLTPAARATPANPEPVKAPARPSVPLAPLRLTPATRATPANPEPLKAPATPAKASTPEVRFVPATCAAPALPEPLVKPATPASPSLPSSPMATPKLAPNLAIPSSPASPSASSKATPTTASPSSHASLITTPKIAPTPVPVAAASQPKILSDEEMKQISVYTSTKRALVRKIIAEERRRNVRLRMAQVPDDGNCFYYAASRLLFGDISHAAQIRKQVTDWLATNGDYVMPSCGMKLNEAQPNWDNFVRMMRKDKEYAEFPCVHALSEIFSITVNVITFMVEDEKYTPRNSQSVREVWMSFCDTHYGPLVLDPTSRWVEIPVQMPESMWACKYCTRWNSIKLDRCGACNHAKCAPQPSAVEFPKQ